MKIIVIIFLLVLASCVTIKPFEIAYRYDIEQQKFCSYKTLKMKEQVCKDISELDAEKWTLLNDAALEKKFNKIFKKFNRCLLKK